jgi:hypothetical protein
MKFVEVQRVESRSKVYFVGLQSAIFDSHFRERIKVIDGKTPEGERDQMAELLLGYVANEDGSQRFANADEAKLFMAEHSSQTCWALITAAQKLNSLSDDAVEIETKN